MRKSNPTKTTAGRKVHLAVRIRGVLVTAFRAAICIGIAYIVLLPLMIKISSSLMSEADLFDQTVRWVPKQPTLANYVIVFQHLKYPQAFVNTMILSLSTALLHLVSSTLVGYGLARFRFRASGLLLAFAVFTLIIPPQMIAIPLYLSFRFFTALGLLKAPGLNMVGTYWPFLLTAATSTGFRGGLFILIMRQTFKNMPDELEEAAYVDGAGAFKTFVQIMLPAASSALIVVFLFAFVWQWNDYVLTNLFLRDNVLLSNTLEGLAHSIYGYSTSFRVQDTVVNNTGMLFVMAPLLILYAVMQRYFLESVERTGIKG